MISTSETLSSILFSYNFFAIAFPDIYATATPRDNIAMGGKNNDAIPNPPETIPTDDEAYPIFLSP